MGTCPIAHTPTEWFASRRRMSASRHLLGQITSNWFSEKQYKQILGANLTSSAGRNAGVNLTFFDEKAFMYISKNINLYFHYQRAQKKLQKLLLTTDTELQKQKETVFLKLFFLHPLIVFIIIYKEERREIQRIYRKVMYLL